MVWLFIALCFFIVVLVNFSIYVFILGASLASVSSLLLAACKAGEPTGLADHTGPKSTVIVHRLADMINVIMRLLALSSAGSVRSWSSFTPLWVEGRWGNLPTLTWVVTHTDHSTVGVT